MYSLRRLSDGAGDSGPMSTVIVPVYGPDNKIISVEYEHASKPRVGVAIRVGSIAGRSYAGQDYWQTTIIEEILDTGLVDERFKFIKFRTKNSEYIWREI